MAKPKAYAPLAQKRLGIVPYLYARPIVSGLKQQAGSMFELVEDSPPQLALQLREKQLDGAFLSPIDYAKDYAMYRIVPGVAVVSEGESESVLLFFREHSRKITTVGFDPRTPSSDIVLAHLIMKEKYNIAPQLVPLVGSIDAALQKTDATLVSGDEAIAQGDRTNRIDLVDEWSDINELPYVHGVWVTREGALTKEEVDAVARSAQATGTSREEIVNDEHRDYLSRFTYNLTDEVVAALTEFFRMAYYHGILQDIPEVRFLPTNE